MRIDQERSDIVRLRRAECGEFFVGVARVQHGLHFRERIDRKIGVHRDDADAIRRLVQRESRAAKLVDARDAFRRAIGTGEADERSVVDYLLFSTANPSSDRNCIENARLNSRAVRTALTGEMWDAINSAWIELQETWRAGPMTREQLARFLRFVQEISLRFDGSAYRTMLRNDAYWFSRLGLHLERADNTARILDVKYHLLLPEKEHVGGPLDYYQWTSILRSVSALTAYHWVYRETLKPWLIADLLILNDSLPRSLASCYGNLVRNLDQIGVAYGRQGLAQRHARGIRNRLEHSRMDDVFQRGLHEFIQEFLGDNARLGEIISTQYLN